MACSLPRRMVSIESHIPVRLEPAATAKTGIADERRACAALVGCWWERLLGGEAIRLRRRREGHATWARRRHAERYVGDTGSYDGRIRFATRAGLALGLSHHGFGAMLAARCLWFSPPESEIYWARKRFWLGRGTGRSESDVMHGGNCDRPFGSTPHILLVSDPHRLSGRVCRWTLVCGIGHWWGAMVAGASVVRPTRPRSGWRARLAEYFTLAWS